MRPMDNYLRTAKVESIHDGDTILCRVDVGFGIYGPMVWVRLKGVFADELNEPKGTVHKNWLTNRLKLGSSVSLQTFKIDSHHDWTVQSTTFSRYVGIVWDDKGNVNDDLLALGVPNQPRKKDGRKRKTKTARN